nr:uncharacterized protein LOC129255392 [Lytechinus pictus]
MEDDISLRHRPAPAPLSSRVGQVPLSLRHTGTADAPCRPPEPASAASSPPQAAKDAPRGTHPPSTVNDSLTTPPETPPAAPGLVPVPALITASPPGTPPTAPRRSTRHTRQPVWHSDYSM